MSFGDPNNPYGAPQGQPQYGYPQQAPQGIPPQAAYGYPQQAGYGYPAGPGAVGYPGAPVPMPGGASSARVILFIVGSLLALAGVLVMIGGLVFASEFSDSSDSTTSDAGTVFGGAFVFLGILFAGVSLWPILTAAKLSKGRTGIRVSGIVFASLQGLFAALSTLTNAIAVSAAGPHDNVGVIWISLIFAVILLVLDIWVIAGLSSAESGAYFRRP
ncbi:hypothetical protein [Streptomyces sp. NPDC089799]|uniref:hypothetical protein n=1 Tax=Streptomyces sp. NPDC089799 TaxID=3155066 RepID=UPI00341D0650